MDVISEAAAERLQLLEAASAECELLRPVAAESQAREILLNENAAGLQRLFADLSERDARIAQLSAALDEATAALGAERTAAADRLELLEAAMQRTSTFERWRPKRNIDVSAFEVAPTENVTATSPTYT